MRLIIADDSMMVREGLTHLLTDTGHEVVATVTRAEPLPAAVQEHRPDAVIIDIRMPPTHTDEGLRAAAWLRPRYPGLGILVLSQYIVPEYAMRILAGGADYTGYLLKDRILEPAQLTSALNRIWSGGTVVDAELIAMLIAAGTGDGPISQLTDREKEVLTLMAEGLSDRGIADALVLSINTVGTHIRHIFDKLALASGPADNRRVLAVLEFLQNKSR